MKVISLLLGVVILSAIASFIALESDTMKECSVDSPIASYSDCIIGASRLEASPATFDGHVVNVKGVAQIGIENFTLSSSAQAQRGTVWVNYKRTKTPTVVDEAWSSVKSGTAKTCSIPVLLNGKYKLKPSGHYEAWGSELSQAILVHNGEVSCQ